MTIHRNLNKYCEGGNYCVWWILQTLKAAGWTVPRSGSGTGGVSDTSDVFGSVADGDSQSVGNGAGQETLGNGKCWLVLEDPGGNRQLIFTRHSTATDDYDGYWWVGYSPSGVYAGGNADTSATAADEDAVSKTGIRGTPAEIYNRPSYPAVFHVAADDTPSSDGEYGFLGIEFQYSNVLQSLTFLDDRRNNATGDTESVILCHRAITTFKAADGNNLGKGRVDPLATAAWADIDLSYIPGTSGNYSARGRNSAYDGKGRFLMAYWCEDATWGYRGTSRWFRCSPMALGYPCTAGDLTVLHVEEYGIVDLLDGTTVPVGI